MPCSSASSRSWRKKGQPGAADAALALHRLYKNAGRFLPDRGPDRGQIAQRNLVEAVNLGAKASEVLLLIARRDHGQRAPVEAAFERNDAIPLRPAVMAMVLTRHFHAGFHRLGARVREEHLVRERHLAKPLRKQFLPRHAVEVRGVPDFARLGGQGFHKVRMGMAQHIDSHARREVEISLAIRRPQIGAFAPLELGICPCIGSKHSRHGWHTRFQLKKAAP